MKPVFPALLFAIVLLAGCLTNDEPAEKSIFPLAVGNTWSYIDSTYHGDDSVTLDSTHMTVTGTRLVVLAAGEQTVYLLNVRDRNTGLPSAYTQWVQDRADGQYNVGAEQEGTSFVFETLHLKHPAENGERYPTHFLDFRREGDSLVPVLDTLEIEVVDTRHACVAPAGTFRCVKYRGWRPGGALHATGYYAPGVGFVGSEVVRTVGVNGDMREVKYHRRLASFTLH
jgi:hypothetical protein